ncbi:MAG: DUF4167 domain-containing protein [Kiloniellales bacterium]
MRGRNGRRPHVPNRHHTFDSNGPEVRIRGNAYQVHEKYLGLARDAASSGDRIAAENFFQHAEHYFRILNASTDPRPQDQGQQPAPAVEKRGDGNAEASASPGRGNGAGGDSETAPA